MVSFLSGMPLCWPAGGAAGLRLLSGNYFSTHELFLICKIIIEISKDFPPPLVTSSTPQRPGKIIIKLKSKPREGRLYRFLGVFNFSDTQIFQGDNSPGFFILVDMREGGDVNLPATYRAPPPDRRYLQWCIQSSRGSYLLG